MYYTTTTASISTQDFIDEKIDLESLMPYHMLIDLRSKNELKLVKLQTRLPDSNQPQTNSEDDRLKYRAVNRAFEKEIIKNAINNAKK